MFTLDAELAVGLGEVLAIHGPSGTGKTTIARAICGLSCSGSVHVWLDGAVLAGPGRYLPAHRRPIALLDQRPLLFPGMSVHDNVACGPQLEGLHRSAACAEARRRCRDVGLEACGDLMLAQLDFAQWWRVALARLLASSAEVLVLDDALGALGEGASRRARALLRPLLWDRITVLLTAAADDVAIADRVARLGAGTLVDAPTADP